MTNYRLYDNVQNGYLNSVNYISIAQAEEDKESFLSDGNYPDDPHTVRKMYGSFYRLFISLNNLK